MSNSKRNSLNSLERGESRELAVIEVLEVRFLSLFFPFVSESLGGEMLMSEFLLRGG